ncbi:hypothetical protein MLD38_034882 [Melastoma candidum]|uniref:Uncharacterized protein n=1 Tax=Melastoma candidum TaxID=119954 RepID=A0ACB9MDA9_9MYRT|nr:hypothetical protein MLD38_034882 [Melastoma candidum]
MSPTVEMENPSPLPPGCRFRPSDHQLLSYYLAPKNSDPGGCSHLIIGEIDFYDLGPSQLPDSAGFCFGRMGGRRHWFCFARRYGNRMGKSRAVRGRGWWRRNGKPRDVVVGGNVLGTRTAFVFHEMGGSGNAVRTNWVLHEYTLADSGEAPFVLCRVFRKRQAKNPTGGLNALELSHDNVQIDGDSCLIPAGGDPNPICPIVELNIHIINGPSAPEIEPIVLARSPEIILSDGPGTNDLAAHEIISILEENFLELNDLVDPLPGTLVDD